MTEQKIALGRSFDVFWGVYPRKTAKKAARKAWNKLNPPMELISAILCDIVERTECQWSEKQFIPHPATYLNGERWEDELIPNNPKPTSPDGSSRGRAAIDNMNDKSWAK